MNKPHSMTDDKNDALPDDRAASHEESHRRIQLLKERMDLYNASLAEAMGLSSSSTSSSRINKDTRSAESTASASALSKFHTYSRSSSSYNTNTTGPFSDPTNANIMSRRAPMPESAPRPSDSAGRATFSAFAADALRRRAEEVSAAKRHNAWDSLYATRTHTVPASVGQVSNSAEPLPSWMRSTPIVAGSSNDNHADDAHQRGGTEAMNDPVCTVDADATGGAPTERAATASVVHDGANLCTPETSSAPAVRVPDALNASHTHPAMPMRSELHTREEKSTSAPTLASHKQTATKNVRSDCDDAAGKTAVTTTTTHNISNTNSNYSNNGTTDKNTTPTRSSYFSVLSPLTSQHTSKTSPRPVPPSCPVQSPTSSYTTTSSSRTSTSIPSASSSRSFSSSSTSLPSHADHTDSHNTHFHVPVHDHPSKRGALQHSKDTDRSHGHKHNSRPSHRCTAPEVPVLPTVFTASLEERTQALLQRAAELYGRSLFAGEGAASAGHTTKRKNRHDQRRAGNEQPQHCHFDRNRSMNAQHANHRSTKKQKDTDCHDHNNSNADNRDKDYERDRSQYEESYPYDPQGRMTHSSNESSRSEGDASLTSYHSESSRDKCMMGCGTSDRHRGRSQDSFSRSASRSSHISQKTPSSDSRTSRKDGNEKDMSRDRRERDDDGEGVHVGRDDKSGAAYDNNGHEDDDGRSWLRTEQTTYHARGGARSITSPTRQCDTTAEDGSNSVTYVKNAHHDEIHVDVRGHEEESKDGVPGHISNVAATSSNEENNRTNDISRNSHGSDSNDHDITGANQPLSPRSAFNQLERCHSQLAAVQRILTPLHAAMSIHRTPTDLPQVKQLVALGQRRRSLLDSELALQSNFRPGLSLREVCESSGQLFDRAASQLLEGCAAALAGLRVVDERRKRLAHAQATLKQRQTQLDERQQARAVVAAELLERTTTVQQRQAALRARVTAYEVKLQEHTACAASLQERIGEVERVGSTVSTWLNILQSREGQLSVKEEKLHRVEAELERRGEDVKAYIATAKRLSQSEQAQQTQSS